MHMSHEQAASRSAGIRPRHVERVTAATLTEDKLAEMMRADATLMVKAKADDPVESPNPDYIPQGNQRTAYDALGKAMTTVDLAEATGLTVKASKQAISRLRAKGLLEAAVINERTGAKIYWRAGQ